MRRDGDLSAGWLLRPGFLDAAAATTQGPRGSGRPLPPDASASGRSRCPARQASRQDRGDAGPRQSGCLLQGPAEDAHWGRGSGHTAGCPPSSRWRGEGAPGERAGSGAGGRVRIWMPCAVPGLCRLGVDPGWGGGVQGRGPQCATDAWVGQVTGQGLEAARIRAAESGAAQGPAQSSGRSCWPPPCPHRHHCPGDGSGWPACPRRPPPSPCPHLVRHSGACSAARGPGPGPAGLPDSRSPALPTGRPLTGGRKPLLGAGKEEATGTVLLATSWPRLGPGGLQSPVRLSLATGLRAPPSLPDASASVWKGEGKGRAPVHTRAGQVGVRSPLCKTPPKPDSARSLNETAKTFLQ